MKSVLVLMSVYNGQKYLRDQIDSLLHQKGVMLHILVRDDGSPLHESIDIINEYISNGQPITLLEGTNLGFALSFSELVKVASLQYADYDYYAFCDQDDVWLENKLLKAIEKLDFKDASKVGVPISYCSATTLVDEYLKPLNFSKSKHPFIITKSNCLLQSCATGCTMVFNRVALTLYANHMPTQLYAHDLMLYQMSVYLGEVIYDTNSYILYRQHGDNQIGSKKFSQRMKTRLNFRKHSGTLQLQAQRLLELYKDMLTVSDIAKISRLAFYKENFFSKLSLLFDKSYRYNNFESNLFYRIKVLMGGGISDFYQSNYVATSFCV